MVNLLYETKIQLMHHTIMSTAKQFFWKERLRASGIHLGASMAVALLAALPVFGLWYPYPYRETSGGGELFFILICVDVALGPLITLAIFNLHKPRRELIRDLSIVVMLQLAALTYGMWTVFVARPAHLVFEFDSFRVVHAIDIPEELMPKAPDHVRAFPVLGPGMLAVRPFKDVNEEGAAMMAALQGLALSARPDLWQSYEEARARVLFAAKPVEELKHRFGDKAMQIDAALAKTGMSASSLAYLPMVDRKSFWTVLLDNKSAEVKGFIPLDSF